MNATKQHVWNPLHPVGTCGRCGEEMVHNVPRLGADGGFVHKNTGKILCADEEAKYEPISVSCLSPQNQINETLHLKNQYEAQINDAIDILDGNKEPINWKDKSQPELLRKLCEHLEISTNTPKPKLLKKLELVQKFVELPNIKNRCGEWKDVNDVVSQIVETFCTKL